MNFKTNKIAKFALLAVVAVFGFTAAPKAEARPHISVSFGHGHGYKHGHYCPPRKIRTCIVHTCYRTKYYFDHCGHKRYYRIKIVTYRSYYSNGTSRSYTRTFRI